MLQWLDDPAPVAWLGTTPEEVYAEIVSELLAPFLGQTTAQAKISHAQARAYIVAAFEKKYAREPTLLEAQFAQAVSAGEAAYGTAAYKNRVTGEERAFTWNMGGVQCGGMSPPCTGNCFEATDRHADGQYYQACFRFYPTPEEGFEHFIGVLYGGKRDAVRQAANTGDVDHFAQVMRDSKYYELAADKYASALRHNLGLITKSLGEPMPSGSVGGSGGRVRSMLPMLAVAGVAAGIFYATVNLR